VLPPPLISTAFFCPFPTFSGSVREEFDAFTVATSHGSSNAPTNKTEFVLVVELPSSKGIAIEEGVTEINWIEWMEDRKGGGVSIALGRD
jgi:hypothetical protein